MIQYQKFELIFQGDEPIGSHSDIDLSATFTCGDAVKEVKGFYAGEGRYVVRFLPQQTGLVQWEVKGVFQTKGEEQCTSAHDGIHHGLVKPDWTALIYEDGTRCHTFGTTVYAMMHQPQQLIKQTLETLLKSPFNKVRTCLFPKHYIFNENEPELFAFEKQAEGRFDFERPCFKFWDAFDQMIETCGNQGIEVDLILFHPYDCWGFAQMEREEYLSYLKYLLARFAAYPNVWWSMANEFDSLSAFKTEDWDCIEQYICENDPYGHMLSCHYMLEPYDYARQNITHCSVQGDVTEVETMIKRYHKPVLMDEFGYEGNIFCHWGHLSGFELVNRFWLCCVMGGYGTHGETFMNPTDTLWWGKGGTLIGSSPKRIGFLRSIIEELPGALEPVPCTAVVTMEKLEEMRDGKHQEEQNDFTRALLKLPSGQVEQILKNFTKDIRVFTGHCNEEAYLSYYGRHCTAVGDLELPKEGQYRVEVIDVWEMTRETILTNVKGKIEFKLPGKEGIAVLATKV